MDIGRTQGGSGFDTVSYLNYRDLNERATTLEGIYAYSTEPRPVSLGGRAEAEGIYGAVVTPNYFRLLQRRFAGDPGLVGQPVTLNGRPFTVAGITPAGFQGTTLLKPDVWIADRGYHLSGAPHRRRHPDLAPGGLARHWGMLKRGVSGQNRQLSASSFRLPAD